MRLGRWIIGIVAGVVLLALLTVLTVTVFVDPNRYRGQIESAVTRATGQPFEIVGDLHISWYPWLALQMGPAQFGKTLEGNPPRTRVRGSEVSRRSCDGRRRAWARSSFR